MTLRLLKSLMLLGLVLGIAACGSVPRPFSPGAKTGALPTPGPASGLIIHPVGGADGPALDPLTAAVTEGLAQRGVAALSFETRNRYRLYGEVLAVEQQGDELVLAFRWQIAAPDGTPRSEDTYRQTVSAAAWLAAAPALVQQQGVLATERVALLLGLSATPTPRPTQYDVVVDRIRGAPGDGAEALGMALLTELTRLNFSPTRDPYPALPRIEAHVTVHPDGQGRDTVRIIWLVLDSNDNERGRLEQQNTVPVNSLARRWGVVAGLAASAAAPGLADLLARLNNSR